MTTRVDNRLSYGGKIYTGALCGKYMIRAEPKLVLVTQVPESKTVYTEDFVFVDSGEREGNVAFGAWVPHWMSTARLAKILLGEAYRAKKESGVVCDPAERQST